MPAINNNEALIFPGRVRLDISTACQLKCPSCPTASGEIRKNLGSGFLTIEKFKKFVDANKEVSEIELSNWGEIFLNKDIVDILQYGNERGVTLTAANGTNLNTEKQEILEAVVKYKLRFMNCSIDGASQETYSIYRVNGNWDRVIRNIKTINKWKSHYKSPFPILRWQYVAFAHNEHEIAKARRLAEDLNMDFHLKLSWGDLYEKEFSPVRDKDLIRRESGLGVADRDEYREKYGKEYVSRHMCMQMWKSPQINADGRLLGCAINFWSDYGNVFEEGLEEALNSEKIIYARRMLMGKEEAKEGIPCTVCRIYANMKKHNHWIDEEDVISEQRENPVQYPTIDSEQMIPSNGYAISICEVADTNMSWKPEFLFRGASACTDFLQCHQSSLIPGHIPHPPHAHPEEELLIVFSGEANLILSGSGIEEEAQHQRVKAGDIVYYPAYFEHTLQAISENPANYLMIKWKNQELLSRNALEYKYYQALDMYRDLEGVNGFSCRTLFEGQTKYLKKLHCHLSFLKSGAGYGEHADDYDVLIFLLEGVVETLGRYFGRNSVIYYAKGEPHGMFNPALIDAKYIVIEFHGG